MCCCLRASSARTFFNIEGVQAPSDGCSSKGFKKIERGRRLTDCESNFCEQFACKSRKKDVGVTVRAWSRGRVEQDAEGCVLWSLWRSLERRN